jgi:6-phosphofructo-2-kinase/fructose-2,6-biphosphatase 2/6-phosphofructo-2-kinase/fructose-2,6-biphosphatase 4
MEMHVKEKKIIIGMCGLPACGKTYISRKVCRYLTWHGYKTKVFNIANYRRLIVGTSECTADFFDSKNEDGVLARNECAKYALKDMEQWLNGEGQIAIYDGTNTTLERRNNVKKYLDDNIKNYELMWVESICNDEAVIEQNIRLTKLHSPDYMGVDQDQAAIDFKKRIEKYRATYQQVSCELDGPDTEFLQIIDIGKQVSINNIHGYLQSRIVTFLMNLHNTPRPIYLTRHGQSLYNIDDRVGGDPDLSEKGKIYAKELAIFLKKDKESGDLKQWNDLKIFTSTLLRARITADSLDLGVKPKYLKLLDEINVGTCDGLTYKEIAQVYPHEAKERSIDKLGYRYPRGESYLDLIERIEPAIFEIERSKIPVIVVGHQAVLRCLYAYFCKHDIPEVPHIDIPLHTILKLVPEAYSTKEKRCFFDAQKVEWKETLVQKPILIDDCSLDKQALEPIKRAIPRVKTCLF